MGKLNITKSTIELEAQDILKRLLPIRRCRTKSLKDKLEEIEYAQWKINNQKFISKLKDEFMLEFASLTKYQASNRRGYINNNDNMIYYSWK